MKCRNILVWGLLSLTITSFYGNLALADSMQEYTVKAIRSLNFARCTQWTVDALNTGKDNVNLCALGNSA